jgi:hypothetical protein
MILKKIKASQPASQPDLFNFIEKLTRYIFFVIQDNQLPP